MTIWTRRNISNLLRGYNFPGQSQQYSRHSPSLDKKPLREGTGLGRRLAVLAKWEPSVSSSATTSRHRRRNDRNQRRPLRIAQIDARVRLGERSKTEGELRGVEQRNRPKVHLHNPWATTSARRRSRAPSESTRSAN